jgi:hypothetical protein
MPQRDPGVYLDAPAVAEKIPHARDIIGLCICRSAVPDRKQTEVKRGKVDYRRCRLEACSA